MESLPKTLAVTILIFIALSGIAVLLSEDNSGEPSAPTAVIPDRDQAIQDIRKKAESDWPADTQKRRRYVESETAAYDQLKQGNTHNIPDPVYNQILSDAINDLPNQFDIQVRAIQRQIKAYNAINTLQSQGIPGSVIADIKSDAEKEWKTDYEMQHLQMKRQISAYKSSNP